MLKDCYTRSWKMPHDLIRLVSKQVRSPATRSQWILLRFNDGNKELCEPDSVIQMIAGQLGMDVSVLEKRVVAHAERLKRHVGYTCIDGKFIHPKTVRLALMGIVRRKMTLARSKELTPVELIELIAGQKN